MALADTRNIQRFGGRDFFELHALLQPMPRRAGRAPRREVIDVDVALDLAQARDAQLRA